MTGTGYEIGSVRVHFPKPRLRDDERIAIAEGLLDGIDPETLIARSTAGGLDAALVQSAIDEARTSIYLQLAERTQARLRKREWTLAIRTQLATENPAELQIPVVRAIEPDRFYSDYYFSNRPVKLTGLVDHWPALERWSLDYFAEHVGNPEVEVQSNRQSSTDYELAKERHQSLMPFAGVVEMLRTCGRSNDIYLTAYNSGVNKTALAPLGGYRSDLHSCSAGG